MQDYLEKIDMIKNRTGVSYKEASEALDEANGDVVEALVLIEEKGKCNFISEPFEELYSRIKEIFKKGQARKVKIKQGERTVLEIPANVGVVGLLATLLSSELALLGALGGVVAMAKKYTLEIEKDSTTEKEEVFFGPNPENKT